MKATKQTFGRDLRAAVPSISVKRPRDLGERVRVYYGIALRAGRWSIETPLGPRGPRSALM